MLVLSGVKFVPNLAKQKYIYISFPKNFNKIQGYYFNMFFISR